MKEGDYLRFSRFRKLEGEWWGVVTQMINPPEDHLGRYAYVDLWIGPSFYLCRQWTMPQQNWAIGRSDAHGETYEVFEGEEELPDEFYVAQAKWALLGEANNESG